MSTELPVDPIGRAALRERWNALALTELAPFALLPSDVEASIGRLVCALCPPPGVTVESVRAGAARFGRWLAERRVPLPVAGRVVEALTETLTELWAECGLPVGASGSSHPGGAAPLLAAFATAALRGYAERAERPEPAAAEPAARPDDDAVRTRLAELDALQRVATATSSSLDLDATLQLAVDSVTSVTHADICSIYLYDETTGDLVLSATDGFPRELIGQVRLDVGEGITGWAAQEGRVIALRDAWADPRFKRFPWLDEQPYRSMASAPIFLHNQRRLIGVLNIQTREYRDYSPDSIRFLETVARQVGLAIENARLYAQTDERLRRKVHELTTLIRVSSAITSTLDVQEVLDLIAGQTVVLSGMDMAAIYELDEARNLLTITASHGLSPEFVESARVPVGEVTAGRTVQTGRPVRVPDVLTGSYSALWLARAQEEGYRSVVGVPLVSQKRVIGALLAYGRAPREIPDDIVDLLLAFATEAALAIENARLYQETRRALATKSALLQEMHHRVKNNLQTVAALLSLQARRVVSADAAQPLRDSVARVESIAAVHDLLSQESIGSTTLEALARQIIEVASVNLIDPGQRIAFSVEGGDVRFASKEATVLALLLNELVANAITHGFEGRTRGRITIAAEGHNGAVIIQVRDDGAGPPPGFAVDRNAGLGLQICQTLVSTDLRGVFTLEAAPEGGSLATIKLRRTDATAQL